MMLTEEEATRKNCCNEAREDTSTRCIGSERLAWRWYDSETQRVPMHSLQEMREMGVPDVEPLTHEVPTTNRRGYCGLAGRPE